jgi:hypothetical protein
MTLRERETFRKYFSGEEVSHEGVVEVARAAGLLAIATRIVPYVKKGV